MSKDALSQALWRIDHAEADDLDAAKARALMIGYHHAWSEGTRWEVISVEEEFCVPVYNPKTSYRSKTFKHAGRWDGVVRSARTPKLFALEHKTCAEEIEDPDAMYWRRLSVDSQINGYMLARWVLGQRLDGVLYDVIRKPDIKPRKLTRAELAEVVGAGTYFDEPVDEQICEAIRDGRLLKETPKLFQLRLTRDVIRRKDRYFQRRVVPRLDAEIAEYADELWHTSKELLEARRHHRHVRNPSACMAYNRPCQYLGVCSRHDSIDSDNWTVTPDRHDELSTVGDGVDVLTNSRINCYRTCPKKHYFRYELGARRICEERSESLVFGSLIHQALESYWTSLKECQDVKRNTHCTEAV